MVATGKRYIILAIDHDLLERARGLAAKRGCSVSALLAAELKRFVGSEQGYEAAMRRARALMSKGLPLGDAQPFERDAVHERHPIR
jgi:hypothetical protein